MLSKMIRENRLLFVILLSLAIIGGVIVTEYMSFMDIETAMISQVKENQMIKTVHAAQQIESHILQVKDELVTLSKFPMMDTLDVNTCSGDMRIIHETIKGKIDSLLRVDEDGNIIECSSPDFSDYLGLNIKNKDYFSVPKETDEPFIAGTTRQGTNVLTIVSAPLFETTGYTPYPNYQGKFKGVLMSIIEVNMLYNIYIHPIIDPDKNLFLLINAETGEIIMGSDSIGDYSSFMNKIPDAKGTLNTIADIDGFKKSIITSSDIILGSETWRLIIITPLENIDPQIDSVQRSHLFSLGLVIVIIIVILFFIITLYRSREKLQLKMDKASVTLEKLGIKIDTEEDKYNQADIGLDIHRIYLIKEEDENHAHELFISTLNKGFSGLGIVRDDPRDIMKKYNLQKTSFIWLTENKIDDIASETDIGNIFKLISEFVSKSKKSVVLIDRLDYLLTNNSYDQVLRTIYALRDLAQVHESIIILSVNPSLVEDSKLKSIGAETIDLYGRHLRNNADLSEMEVKLLKYVNERNVNNLLVSYKDITLNLKITKPTTRSKISRLQQLGLLQVEEKGRFKSLKITSSGRKIIGY